jgi:hypothetical protein
MFGAAIRFVRMPWLLIVIWVVARFSLGLAGVPYAPRGNAMFSVFGLTLISGLYFGALSKRNFSWKGTIVIGIAIGLFAQVLIFLATLISYVGGLQTYFVHWDALNVPEGTIVPMSRAMAARAGGLLFGGMVIPSIVALIGRALGGLAPEK